MTGHTAAPAPRRAKRRWKLPLIVAAVAVAAAAAGGWFLLASPGIHGLVVLDEAGTRASGISISAPDKTPPAALSSGPIRAVTKVFGVEAKAPLGHPLVLRFDLPRGLGADRLAHLAVADQKVGGGGWALTPAVVEGNTVVYKADHLSLKQVVEITGTTAKEATTASYDWLTKKIGLRADGACPTAVSSPYEAAVSAPGAGESPPVLACPGQAIDGRPTVTLSNQRGTGMDVFLPAGGRVEATSNADLSEAAWKAVYEALGTDLPLLPAGGTMVVSFDELPADIGLSANNSSFATDAVIAAAAKGRSGSGQAELGAQLAEVAQCAQRVAEAGKSTSDEHPQVNDKAWEQTRDVWFACGGALNDVKQPSSGGPGNFITETLFGAIALPVGLFDNIRGLAEIRGETIRLAAKGGGVIVAPSAGYVARFDFRWATKAGEKVDGVLEIGKFVPLTEAMSSGFSPQCYAGDPSRAGYLNGYFQITARTPGFNTDVSPRLVPEKFEIVRGLFSGDDLGGRLTDDQGYDNYGVAIESLGKCRQPWRATESMYGQYTLVDGQRTETINFDLVYANVYGPARPEGDPDHIASLGLALDAGLGVLEGTVVCISGPGTGFGTFLPVTGQDGLALGKKYGVDVGLRTPSCGHTGPSEAGIVPPTETVEPPTSTAPDGTITPSAETSG